MTADHGPYAASAYASTTACGAGAKTWPRTACQAAAALNVMRQATNEDPRHHALPYPQGHDRLAFRPLGPRHDARGRQGGQCTEQEQREGDQHGHTL
ncbi:hypothetical protein SCYAM73S_02863 [Streptomyces cyaneofuscatus]